MERKKNIKEKQDLHNKSDWGGPQQDNQTQKGTLTGSNTSLNENVRTKEDQEETDESDLDGIEDGNLGEPDLDFEERKNQKQDDTEDQDDTDENEEGNK